MPEAVVRSVFIYGTIGVLTVLGAILMETSLWRARSRALDTNHRELLAEDHPTVAV